MRAIRYFLILLTFSQPHYSNATVLSIHSTLTDPEQASSVIELLRCLSDETDLAWELVDKKDGKTPLLELTAKERQIRARLSVGSKIEEKVHALASFASYYCSALGKLSTNNDGVAILDAPNNEPVMPTKIETPEDSPKHFWRENRTALAILAVATGAFLYIRTRDPGTKGMVLNP